MYSQYEKDKILITCHPSPRQLTVEQMEFYAFAHFGVNTFTDREWGNGTESPMIFDPTEFNPNQWVQALKSAGIKGLILTCKHHDGFCLWPSAYTEFSVKNSPYLGGNGDIVQEVERACREGGIAFGVYLSPWDRNCALYGQGEAYDDYFCNQLTELCTRYGQLFCVWFDGACGEGANGKKQVYDWERYYGVIRKYQPNACISICGPDIRWCGNEAGDTRESEWSVLPTAFDDPNTVAEKSQKSDDTAFRQKKIIETERDLGSRLFLEGASNLAWRPSETDVSIRPGWFYHSYENEKVRSTQTLLDIWYRTVGGNSMLLLNIPPDRRGLFHEVDVQRLREMGEYLRKTFGKNLAENARITADRDDGCHFAENVKEDTYDAFFKTKDGENTASITITLAEKEKVSHVVLKEHIPMSQRVERFAVEAKLDSGEWRTVAEGTTIGYKRVLRFEEVLTQRIRIRIQDSRVCPVISFIGVY